MSAIESLMKLGMSFWITVFTSIILLMKNTEE